MYIVVEWLHCISVCCFEWIMYFFICKCYLSLSFCPIIIFILTPKKFREEKQWASLRIRYSTVMSNFNFIITSLLPKFYYLRGFVLFSSPHPLESLVSPHCPRCGAPPPTPAHALNENFKVNPICVSSPLSGNIMRRFHVSNETSSATERIQAEVIELILDGSRNVLITAFSVRFNESEII
jgi:hypothetical protein